MRNSRVSKSSPPTPTITISPSACSLVFADNLVEETRCEVCAIFVGRAARHDDVLALAGQQFADQPCRPRRRRNETTRVASQSQAELQHVPSLERRPRTQLIADRCVVLRTPQPFRLLGAKRGGDCSVRPSQAPFRGLI